MDGVKMTQDTENKNQSSDCQEGLCTDRVSPDRLLSNRDNPEQFADDEVDNKRQRTSCEKCSCESTCLVIFSVILPVFDVATDILAGISLMRNGHAAWGTAVVSYTLLPGALRLACALILPMFPPRCW